MEQHLFVKECAEVHIKLGEKEIVVSCYIDSKMSGGTYHLLLGNSFLDALDNYKITKDGFEFEIENEITFCPKIRDG